MSHPSTEAGALKPCPFCGATKPLRFNQDKRTNYVSIVCDASSDRRLGGCGAASGYEPNHDKAAQEWNKRAAPEPGDGYPVGEYPDWPECREFYDLCQAYRHAPHAAQDAVSAHYEALKYWLRGEVHSLKSRQPETKGANQE